MRRRPDSGHGPEARRKVGVVGVALILMAIGGFYALPFGCAVYVGLAAGFWAVGTGAGVLVAFLVGIGAGALVLVAGQVVFAVVRWPALRFLVALIFARRQPSPATASSSSFGRSRCRRPSGASSSARWRRSPRGRQNAANERHRADVGAPVPRVSAALPTDVARLPADVFLLL